MSKVIVDKINVGLNASEGTNFVLEVNNSDGYLYGGFSGKSPAFSLFSNNVLRIEAFTPAQTNLGGRMILKYGTGTTTLAGEGLMIDRVNGQFRVFEGASPWRGCYLQYSECATGSASHLYHPNNVKAAATGTYAANTGGIIESGSNANGYYEKFAGGLVIIHRFITTHTNGTTYYYPVTLIEEPEIVTTIFKDSLYTEQTKVYSKTSSTYTLWHSDHHDVSYTTGVHVMIVGRWAT